MCGICMYNCELCKRNFTSLKGLQTHVSHFHKITSQTYYDTYLKKKGEGFCYCGKTTKFKNMRLGYHTYCSTKCQSNDPKILEVRAGKNKGDNHWTHRLGRGPNQGKSYNEIYGEEKAEQLKMNLSKLGKKLVGRKNPFYGKQHTEQSKQKIALFRRGKTYEELYGFEKAKKLKEQRTKHTLRVTPWRDYWSDYPIRFFDKNYRLLILKEQNFKCPICFRNINFKNLKNLHHINYVKKDNRRRNLIFLCVSCHSSTNHNRRMWKVYLRQVNRTIIENQKLQRKEMLEIDKEQSLYLREILSNRRIHSWQM